MFIREIPAIGASPFEFLCVHESIGKLGDDDTTTNTLFIDAGTFTEPVGRVAGKEEEGAEVKCLVIVGIGRYTTGATFGGVSAGKYLRGRLLVKDGPEAFQNGLGSVGPEIILVNRIIDSVCVDVERNDKDQVPALDEAVFEQLRFGLVLAVDCSALFEVAFTLGDAVGGGGLGRSVEPGGLEPRDRVEGEGSRSGGGKIVHGGHYQGIQLDRGRDRSFEFESLPLYSAITASPAEKIARSSLER